MDRVIYDLKNNPFSRRILTNIYVHQDLHEMNLYPCAYSMTFNVTQKIGHDKLTLNAVLNQRSQDVLAANNWNVVQYSVLFICWHRCAIWRSASWCMSLRMQTCIRDRPDTDLVFLCEPNNPTGQCTKHSLLTAILERCRECSALLVLDECFLEFLPDRKERTLLPYLGQYPNLSLIHI